MIEVCAMFDVGQKKKKGRLETAWVGRRGVSEDNRL